MLALLALKFSQNMSKWNWQISSCLVMSQVEACALPPTNYNLKGQRSTDFFQGRLTLRLSSFSMEEVPCHSREGNVATRRMLS